jgi:KDO2-lipid IV(A) lauroyltransferase
MPLSRAHASAQGLARAHLWFGGRRVRWALQNLAIAFPSWSQADRNQLALQSSANFLWDLLDLRRSEHWSAGELLARFSFEGLDHLGAALDSGHGALLLSLHMGCYDLGLHALSVQLPALRFAAIFKPLRSRPLQAWLNERRNGGAVEVIASGPRAGLRALRVLRSGRPLVVLNDLYLRGGRRVAVPLFGRRCLTSTGPAVLARLAQASILPCYVLRDAPDHHVLRILPALERSRGDSPADDEATAAACNAALEQIIRKHPEHWTWAHRRFRRSPDLPPGIYRRVTPAT